MSEADAVIVLDTGSEDDTVDQLRRLGAQVTQEKIEPWRFDAARNRSLKLVPQDADICVCTDLDEVFHPGWRAAVERAWDAGVQQLRYRYTWNFRPDGGEGVVFWIDNIHAREGFSWVNPVHEVLRYDGPGVVKTAFAEGVQLDHHADESKSRGQYLPLLELAVAERPEDDRNVHYLGREYLFHRRWDEAAAMLAHHLQMPTATWRDERCASMRYLARCMQALHREEETETWLLRACGEAPWLREPWLDLARFLYQKENWPGVIFSAGRALEITQRPRTYITEAESWSAEPYDLLSLAYYYTGQYTRALAMGEEAVKRDVQNRRLRDNLRLIRQRVLCEQEEKSTIQ